PLNAYLGDKNTYKDSEIRALLTPLAALASRLNIVIVGIMHCTKDEQRKALYRALGSVAFVAAARTVFAVGKHPDDPDRRVLACVKNNLAQKPPALAFSIVDYNGRGRVEWEDTPLDNIDADDVLSNSSSEEREERNDAREFLRETLPREANEVI